MTGRGTRLLPRGFRVWVGATTVSQVGDTVGYLALGWAASGCGGVAAGPVPAGVTVPGAVSMLVGARRPTGWARAPSC